MGRSVSAPNRKAAGATLLVIVPQFVVKRIVNQLSGCRCSQGIEQASIEPWGPRF